MSTPGRTANRSFRHVGLKRVEPVQVARGFLLRATDPEEAQAAFDRWDLSTRLTQRAQATSCPDERRRLALPQIQILRRGGNHLGCAGDRTRVGHYIRDWLR